MPVGADLGLRWRGQSGAHYPAHMLTSSFIHAKGMSEEQERLLWGRGILDWKTAREQADEVTAILGGQRASRVLDAVAQSQAALDRRDSAWFAAHWPREQTWRLWKGWCDANECGLLDIETSWHIPACWLNFRHLIIAGWQIRKRVMAQSVGHC